jgi:hypothetical protein
MGASVIRLTEVGAAGSDALVEFVNEGRLYDLGLVCGSRCAHGRRCVAIGRCVPSIAIGPPLFELGVSL